MSTTMKLKVSDMKEAMKNYGQAAAIMAREGEDREKVKRFKYAVGKNYTAIRQAAIQVEKRQQKMKNEYSDPELDEYNRKRVEICEQCCEREENGAPKVMYYDDDHPAQYQIEAGLKEEFKKQNELLKEEYADAIKRKNDHTEAVEAIMDEEVEIKLYQFPYSDVPSNLAGGYLVAIEDMLTGLPDID
jgi:hypothetical protein